MGAASTPTACAAPMYCGRLAPCKVGYLNSIRKWKERHDEKRCRCIVACHLRKLERIYETDRHPSMYTDLTFAASRYVESVTAGCRLLHQSLPIGQPGVLRKRPRQHI